MTTCMQGVGPEMDAAPSTGLNNWWLSIMRTVNQREQRAGRCCPQWPWNTDGLSLRCHARPQNNVKKDKSEAEFRSIVAVSYGSLARTWLLEIHAAFRLSPSFLYQPVAEAASSKLKLKGYRLSGFQLGHTTPTWHQTCEITPWSKSYRRQT